MVSQQLLNIIIKAQDQASSTAKKVDESIKQIGKSSSMLSKIPGFDTMKSKISSVAQTLDGRFGGALTKARNNFSTLKNSVTSVTSTIRSKFGGAVDGIRNKLSGLSKSTSNLQSGFGFLRGAASMAAGMIGYDLVNSLMENTRASLNARSSIQSFGTRLNMTGTEVSNFQADLDKLQSTFKKVDMDVVGQQAMDMAFRLGLPKESLTQLTETSAIFTDAMQRNGRSAEDATLALADAMDGEFRRLKEIGISQEDLMKNGWDGDINNKTGLLNAMNKSLKEQHYDELAKSVDNLDDAWQVLSITMSNLLESILVPLTPVLVGIVTGVTSAIDSIKGVVKGIQDAFNGLPDFAKLGLGVGIVAGAIALIAFVLWTTYIPAWIAAAAATWAAIAPVLPIVIAIGVAIGILVAAVFEVGKAFGWWTDVGSMLDAIKSGVMRLWEAFINHPDVQAAIQWISNALSTLWSWIVQAGQAVLEFFGISTGGEFDVVRALIESIGFAWQVISTPIRTVIWLLQAAWSAGAAAGDAIGGFYNDTIAPFAEFISGVFAPVWQTLIDMWNGFTEAAMPAVEVIQQFMQGNADLGEVAVAVVTAIWNMWLTFTVNLSNLLLTLAGNMWSWASQAGMNFLNGIATYLSQLALRVYNYLNSAKINIINQLSSWVSNARTKASQFVTGIISFISQLPARVYNYLVAVVSRIVSAGQQWVNSAKNKAKEVVDNVGNTLSDMPNKVASALGGVASAIAKPFEEAYNRVADLVGKIKDKASELSGISLPAMGGDLPMDGDLPMGGDLSVSSGSPRSGGVPGSSDSPMVLDHNLNVTLDFSNVPGHISTEQLVSALTDKGVIRELVNNRDFQLLDNQAKERLNLKINRARGV